MKYPCTGGTQKSSNGRLISTPKEQKKERKKEKGKERSPQMLKSRLTISSTFKELCIMNLFFNGNLSTNITTASAGLQAAKTA
jgi:hypothetical protein